MMADQCEASDLNIRLMCLLKGSTLPHTLWKQ